MKRPILTATIATLLSCAASSAFALTIFVSNEKDNTVTVIDGKTLEVIKTIPTARRPRQHHRRSGRQGGLCRRR
jgi:YVTN family beta-propeller protein